MTFDDIALKPELLCDINFVILSFSALSALYYTSLATDALSLVRFSLFLGRKLGGARDNA